MTSNTVGLEAGRLVSERRAAIWERRRRHPGFTCHWVGAPSTRALLLPKENCCPQEDSRQGKREREGIKSMIERDEEGEGGVRVSRSGLGSGSGSGSNLGFGLGPGWCQGQ